MVYYSPLRYPGGKRRLFGLVTRLLEANGLKDIDYAESFAGGASLALALLFNGYAQTIYINDLNRSIYAFWHSVLNETKGLCERIQETAVTMDEWHRQHEVHANHEDASLLDLGFATFYLNRTNRAGIIHSGGVIGGQKQDGVWSLDARFNKENLIERIHRVAKHRGRIKLYQLDAFDFTDQVVSALGSNTLSFHDPPYLDNGHDLYLDVYELADHHRLAKRIMQVKSPWVVTYDYDAAVREDLYPDCPRIAFGLSYSVNERRKAKEALFLSRNLKVPSKWATPQGFSVVSKPGNVPLFGKLETRKTTKHVPNAYGGGLRKIARLNQS